MKKYWRYYRDYVNSFNMEEAIKVLDDLFENDGPCTAFARLAVHFANDHGRLPDHMHAALILTGGDLVGKYLEKIAEHSEVIE
jgi:hypothetical protein